MVGRASLPIESFIGRKFNKLTIIDDAGFRQGKRQRARLVRCRCDCGNTVDHILTEVKAGRKQSCGCAIAEGNSRRHSMTDTRIYNIWVGMRQRILNPKASGYQNYGGRGITFDPAWESFERFVQDMGLPPSDMHTLDRRDPNGNYCKENCRWVTMDVQVRNRRTSVILEHDGRRMNLVDWARELGIHPMTLRGRLDKGWSVAEALTVPKIDQRVKRTWRDTVGSNNPA